MKIFAFHYGRAIGAVCITDDGSVSLKGCTVDSKQAIARQLGPSDLALFSPCRPIDTLKASELDRDLRIALELGMEEALKGKEGR